MEHAFEKLYNLDSQNNTI